MRSCDHEEEYELDCDECELELRSSALTAGIPLSVIEGKTRIQDHFTQVYIDMQKGEPN